MLEGELPPDSPLPGQLRDFAYRIVKADTLSPELRKEIADFVRKENLAAKLALPAFLTGPLSLKSPPKPIEFGPSQDHDEILAEYGGPLRVRHRADSSRYTAEFRYQVIKEMSSTGGKPARATYFEPSGVKF